ncbi:MAG: prephenate dehydratase [Bacteroidales bacterium]
MKKVTIQGVRGCYHEVTANNFFHGEEVKPIECETFNEVFNKVCTHEADYAVVAIENTIAGSLLQNYELLNKSGLRIIGEYKQRISHCFAVLPGQKMEEITEVWSHPIALMQCTDFLSTVPHVKVVEKSDTAWSAKMIAEGKLTGHAAICSREAAAIYGLEVLESGIESNKRNFTRFMILTTPERATKHNEELPINKASLAFALPHKEGSLSQVLSIFSFYGLNLTKIQSLPIIGREWEYLFYIDLGFSDALKYKQSIEAIKPLTKDFITFGEYHEAE